MLNANAQELFLSNLMIDVIRADLSTLQRRKLGALVSSRLFALPFLNVAVMYFGFCRAFTDAICV